VAFNSITLLCYSDHDDPNRALCNVCFISNFSGDCCNPALRINVIDVDGFISQCELSFSNGESVHSVEVVSTPSAPNKSVSVCQMVEIFKVIKS
jgi:hypothetical protein